MAIPINGGTRTRGFGDVQWYDYQYYHVGNDTASLNAYSGAIYAAHFHAGTDYTGGDGLVRAPEASVITFAGWASPGSAEDGGGIIAEGKIAGGMSWVSCHMASLKVGLGAKVARGQVVGVMDTTGRATGPHVHEQLYTIIGYGQRLFWNFEEFLPGGIHAASPLILPQGYKLAWAPYSARRVASIARATTVYGYDPNRPGAPVLKYTAPTTRGSSFYVDGKMTVTWTPAPGPIPRGTFLHGDRTLNPATCRPYGGVFAGLLVVPTAVTAGDGKVW